ncbi:hypothetical protein AHAS_Ahas20G0298800 [Arachis hypogaea]
MILLHFQKNWLCSPCFDTPSLSFYRFLSSIMASNSFVIPNGSGNGNGIGKLNPPPNLQRNYQVVVAATPDMGIGKDGKLPWKLPTDLKFFKEVTVTTSDPGKKNAVVMGRKTWDSIPLKYRPLPGRLNVVLTRSDSFDIARAENVVICRSMASALELLAEPPYILSIEKIFVIGGGQIFRETLNAPGCEAIHITEIQTSIECDTFMPPVDSSVFQLWYSSFPKVENNIRYSFTTYVRVRRSVEHATQNTDPGLDNNSDTLKFEFKDFSFLPKMILERHEEYKYLRLVEEIISEGTAKDDRTRTGTLSKFGCQLSIPHLTLFRYTNMHADYSGQGIDQLLDVITKIRHNPNDRRIILSAWNPADLKLAALPPCHMFAQVCSFFSFSLNKALSSLSFSFLSAASYSFFPLQFYVANGELSCQMYQRSADMGLGVPFNIASYALLTCIIAHVCGM